ncbi:MAG: hypothetical protein JRJ19_15295, partial [Deltaproteobacteria bacterium]|nr:hypothetical protein [Deltaproteobacteria bacterium]
MVFKVGKRTILPISSILAIGLLVALSFFACSSTPSNTNDDGGYEDADAGHADGDQFIGPDLNPTEEDTDGDGIPNDVEDKNDNGIVDDGETDPN